MKLDKILMQFITENIPDNECAVLLSGGVDSLSCAVAAHRLGKKIHAHTFHLEGDPTYDSRMAEHAASVFGWNIKTTVVSTRYLERDFLRLIYDYDCKKKTQVECTFPFLYLAKDIKVKYVLSGIGGDSYYGLSKRVRINFKRPKNIFDRWRTEYFQQENAAGILQLRALCDQYNKILLHPYLWYAEIYDFFMEKDWDQLNSKQEKHHAREAFADEFAQIGKIKPHLNLQLVANIDDLFLTLLDNKKINFRNRIRVMDMCHDWWAKKRQEERIAHET